MPYTLDQRGKLLIAKREAIVLTAYQDGEHRSIGMGSNDPSLRSGDKITVKQAFERFAIDIARREQNLKNMFLREPSQDEFNALFSCYYQSGNRCVPWLVTLHNAKAPPQIVGETFSIRSFCTSKAGVYMTGLEKRRKIEGRVYASGEYEKDLWTIPLYHENPVTGAKSVPYEAVPEDLA